jgi:type I restriction enzyme S subunit
MWWINSPHFREEVAVRQVGTTRKRISRKNLAAIRFPVPPLIEQRRIVTAIDERLSRLDAADVGLSGALRRLDVLEGAVLDDLFGRIDAPTATISSLAVFVTDGDHNPPKRVPQGVPHLTAKNVKAGRLLFEGTSFVSDEGYEQTRRRYEPRAGDVIVTCVGTIGQTAVVPHGVVFSADRNLAAIRPAEDVDPQYLRLALTAPRSQTRMAVASGATAQPHLYLRDLRSLTLPKPSVVEQRRIVVEVEERLNSMSILRVAIERSQRRSRVIRRAVLSRAFRGALVPQDPSDEPASILLDRIRSEAAPLRAGRHRVRA